jgi:hypothetical protein
MKNIHILPTDKPSRLFIWGDKLRLGELVDSPDYFPKLNQNIYITSDEEIKEGDWFMDDNNSLKTSYKLSHVQFANPKKIILTTDQDLIKDGVQAIDDEFLEWFVMNPSCEEVDVLKCPIEGLYTVIPKEEPKQERSYSEEEVWNLCNELASYFIGGDTFDLQEWFEQRKKK